MPTLLYSSLFGQSDQYVHNSGVGGHFFSHIFIHVVQSFLMSSLTDLMRLFSDVPISLFNAASIQYLETFVVSIQLVLLH